MARAELPWWAASARWLLAAIFLATGLGKALDLPGFAAVLGPYRLLPEPLLLPAAIAVTAAEFAIAAGLAVRPTLRPAAWAGLALALVNAAALTLTLARGIALENCGCFGVFLARPLQPWTPLEDLVLAGLALAVLAGRAGRPRAATAPC
jgi:uncharacterized membrane protein YphA (DoxX/SURF4 family)